MINFDSSYNNLKIRSENNGLSIFRDVVNGRDVAIISNRIVTYLDNHYWFDLKYTGSKKEKHKKDNSGGDRLDSRLRKIAKEIAKEKELSKHHRAVITVNCLTEDYAKLLAGKVVKSL